MKNLKEIIPLLKLGTSNSDYPLYAQYLHSDGESVETCNDDVFIHLKYPLPFSGDVNLFVLDGVLKASPNDIETIIGKGKIVLKTASIASTLNIFNMPFPKLEKPDVNFVDVTEDLLSALRLAMFYTSSSEALYSTVFLCAKYICATDKYRLYFKEIDINLDSPLSIDKTMLSVLTDNCRIGSAEGKVVVEYPDLGGYAIFSAYSADSYPAGVIQTTVILDTTKLQKLCNILVLQDAVNKLTPIFFGEKIPIIAISNKDKQISVVAESMINGKATFESESKLEDEFELSINSTFFKNIPIDFDVFISKEHTNKLYLTDGEMEGYGASIILMEYKQ